MRISYKSHPALQILETRDYSKIRVVPNGKIKKPNAPVHLVIKDGIGKKYCPTKTFIEAFEKTRDSFKDLSMLNDLETQTTLLVSMDRVTAIRIDNNDRSGSPIFYYCSFFNDVLFAHGSFIVDCNTNQLVVDNECNDIGVESNGSDHLIGLELALLLFIRFAEVETKVLPPKSDANFISCSYKNDTKSIVTILNSTWYTTLVKSEGFNVRGHFRLQPYKRDDGTWDKKIIFINPFKKTGYTAPARKLAST